MAGILAKQITQIQRKASKRKVVDLDQRIKHLQAQNRHQKVLISQL
jgi:hypothetical protein